MGIKDIYEAVINYDEDKVIKYVKEELAKGTDVSEILNNGLIAAMDEVGRLYSEGEIFVPEMLRSALAMKKGLELLKPYLLNSEQSSKGVIVMGTVKGDLHDIGKSLVGMMLEGAGFEVIDLGVDVDAEKFITVAEEKGAKIIGLSALLTTTMPEMGKVIKLVKEKGLNVKVIVGGAPVTAEFAEKIGADGHSVDAAGAVELARRLVGQ
ncbi:corrinoid protein [Carboxydothermus ferrireducens]|uniref:5-methyltetrahydrofolate--homocysteine methyltransferase n=1 Tax=Carboxydothermus ferrireducens DSM 11255 TaxID=1119529 RepID=A0ABX2RCB7_9THEO|nr:corrinoid protein [Carboxydothermus ferrireducens]NYE58509.1 5-methyltetrahydrofolate--homocysteine methyltransferase [Carboxydothermus ferrireducens DSM 11255]